MKKLLELSARSLFMLVLATVTVLSMTGCKDDELASPRGKSIQVGLPGNYEILSIECSAGYDGYLADLHVITLSQQPTQSGVITVTFTGAAVSLFGSGSAIGNSVNVVNTQAALETVELRAQLEGNILRGQFVVKNVGPAAQEDRYCDFEARRV